MAATMQRPGRAGLWRNGIGERFLATLGGLLCCASVLAQTNTNAAPAAAAATTNAPRIACDESTFDFGTRDESEAVDHEFILRNTGTAPLAITQVRPGCGCTVAAWNSKTIEPGGQVALPARLKLQRMRGKQRKSIMVESNDPAQPFFRVWLTGTVSTELALEPSQVQLGDVSPTNPASQLVYLVSRVPGARITDVKSDSNAFAAELLKEGEGDKRYSGIRVRTVPPLATGTHRGVLSVATDHPTATNRLTLTLSARVQGEVTGFPAQLTIRQKGDASAARAILIRPGTAKQFKILEVVPPVPEATATITAQGAGTYRIEIQNLKPSPEIDGKSVRILTDLTQMKEINVPIKVTP